MAPEFYDNLPCHNSWIRVLYDFITCSEMGPYSRVKRDYKLTSEYAILNGLKDKHDYNKLSTNNVFTKREHENTASEEKKVD